MWFSVNDKNDRKGPFSTQITQYFWKITRGVSNWIKCLHKIAKIRKKRLSQCHSKSIIWKVYTSTFHRNSNYLSISNTFYQCHQFFTFCEDFSQNWTEKLCLRHHRNRKITIKMIVSSKIIFIKEKFHDWEHKHINHWGIVETCLNLHSFSRRKPVVLQWVGVLILLNRASENWILL